MPMPTDGLFPPTAYAPAYASYREWDALYAGNPDKLREAFLHRGAGTPDIRNRPAQYRGGIVGKFARFMWGHPVPDGRKDPRLHMPLPADLAATAAKLLFGEPAKLKGPEKNTNAQGRLDRFNEAGLHGFLFGAAEACSALGDVYLRPVIDKGVSPTEAIPTVVHADGTFPVFRWGRLVECTFWSVVEADDSTVFRLFELHEKGRDTYRVARGSRDRRGDWVEWRNLPASLAHLRDFAAADLDAQDGQYTGLKDRLDVVHVPNDGPQREWRTDATLKYLGRSDFSGAEQWFDAADETWTSWMRDIRHGRSRLHVPEFMLSDLGPGKGASWDADREVYELLTSLPQQVGTSPITATQFAIRWEEHRSTIEAIQDVILRHAGLSSSTLGDPPDGAQKTATEFRATERLSFMTGDRRRGIWGPRIADYIETHTAVEQAAGLPGAVEPFRPDVTFADSVAEDPHQTAETVQLLRAAEAVSIRTAVQMAHPEWEKKDVDEEVDRIKAERPGALEDPEFSGLGSRSGQPPTSEPGQDEQPKPAPPKGDA
jgi:hypothetical protein